MNSKVKVKMTLKHADVKVNDEASRPAAAAAVEAVEARWREEDRKRRSASRVKAIKGFFSWMFLLVVIPGAAWYFFGDRVLPAEWTFPQVYERVAGMWPDGGSAKGADDQRTGEDPADAATAARRASLRTMIEDLEDVCMKEPPVQGLPGAAEKLRSSSDRDVFEPIVAADGHYRDACALVAKMEAKNEKLALRRTTGSSSGNRKFIDQHSDQDIARGRVKVNEALAACAVARLRSVKMAYSAVRKASATWTGPESRAEVAVMRNRLEKLYGMLFSKISADHPGEAARFPNRLTER